MNTRREYNTGSALKDNNRRCAPLLIEILMRVNLIFRQHWCNTEERLYSISTILLNGLGTLGLD
jgi:hypothetical protein